ncbi:hypothetical protein HanPI659440_Chr00c11g0724201 [Helianthus annuus]|nr:hypothetical protein HanPI659440_Chr00c11g0724201 [Helianthus annuus]
MEIGGIIFSIRKLWRSWRHMFKTKSMYVFYFILSCGFEQRRCRYAVGKKTKSNIHMVKIKMICNVLCLYRSYAW